MNQEVGRAEVILDGTTSDLAKLLRGRLASLEEDVREAVMMQVRLALVEVERPPAVEDERGAHKRLDGSGWRVFRKQDDNALALAKETLEGFLAAFKGDIKGSLSSVGKLGLALFKMNRDGVEVDWHQGAVIAVLEGRPAGRTTADIAERLPQDWDLTLADVESALGELEKMEFRDGQPVVVRAGTRWVAPNV